MDYQRKRTYGFRQEILMGANSKLRILSMIDDQIGDAVDRFTDDDYGASCFAEFASNRLGVEFDASEFSRCDFAEAETAARNKASRLIPTQIHEAMEENLPAEEDQREWNWQAMSNQVNKRWSLKTHDRQLKQIGRDELAQHLIELAEKSITELDLTGGRDFLAPDWGLRSICDWTKFKFQIEIKPQDFADKGPEEIKKELHGKVMALYRQKEVEFPVKLGMARFMAEKAQQGGQRYDREGLFLWANQRFEKARDLLKEDDFRTEARSRLQLVLLEASRRCFPQGGQEQIDAYLEDAFEGTRLSESEDAKEIAAWAKSTLDLEVPEASLTGITQDAARQILWNAFDLKYRPEMRGMERSLVLNQLDQSWKNHLYSMDHLRSTVGLRSYGQEDPKTVYKREGMKEFDDMWDGVNDKVTDAVFRMEEGEEFRESLWTIGATIKEEAQTALQMPASEQEKASAGHQSSGKKAEPIRNRTAKIGRNEPCPCGSGKKYKNCCMRQAV
jgi:preprotein translocase subunit SecA